MIKNQYLKQGKQTKITKKVITIAAGFKLSGFDLIFEILNWLHKNIKLKADSEYKNQFFRKRTAEQVIDSGYATGCTDYGLVFITLARAKNIPAKYIEAVSTQWLEKGDMSHLEGHVFSEVQINRCWYIIDSHAAVIKAWYGRRFEVLAEGLDSWDIGVKNLEDLKKRFKQFRDTRLK